MIYSKYSDTLIPYTFNDSILLPFSCVLKTGGWASLDLGLHYLLEYLRLVW